MAKIHVLSEHLTNMIAAGEVVERPAGIVKECVENSIDAKSTEIKIELIDAGTKQIKVIDNGVGMDKEDAVLCFGLHATSKIKTEDDLVDFLITNIPNFAGYSQTAYNEFMILYAKALKMSKLPDINGGTYELKQVTNSEQLARAMYEFVPRVTYKRQKDNKTIYSKFYILYTKFIFFEITNRMSANNHFRIFF